MWFGTENGLQRYDGKKIIMFRNPQGEGDYLPSQAISQIFEDNKANFWVRFGREVGIFDPATFRYRKAQIEIEGEIPVRSEFVLWQDNDGSVVLIARQQGHYTYDSATHRFTKKKNLFELRKNWKTFQITRDPNRERYWIISDSGLSVFDPVQKKLYDKHYNPEKIALLSNPTLTTRITAFHIDRHNKAWIVNWLVPEEGDAFHCYDLNTDKLVPNVTEIKGDRGGYHEVRSFFEQRNGQLWAYGRKCLLEKDSLNRRFNQIYSENYNEYMIRYDIMLDMFEDREGNIWLATNQGVYAFNPASQPFNSISLGQIPPSTGETSVTGFAETNTGEIWVSSWGKGIIRYDSNFVNVSKPISVPKDETDFQLVWSIIQQNNTGLIWAGCQSGKLIVHDPVAKTNRFLNLPVFERRTIRQLVEDKRGNIWLGTQYGHLVKWDGSLPETKLEDRFSLKQNFQTIIYKLYIDSKGFLWACTHEKGLYKIDPGTGEILAHYKADANDKNAIISNVVFDIIQYDDSTFIVSTGSVNVLNAKQGSFRHIGTLDGMPSQNVRSLNIDNQGTIWLGMMSGLSRYNFKKNIFTSFSPRDGLLNSEFESVSTLKTRSGMMLFGTSHDFTYFRPETITPSSEPPNVSITDFKLFNSYLPPDSIMKLEKVRLDHTQNSITVEFAALSFLQKDKIIYYYKLDGIDDEWTRTESLLFANYTLLPPGDYTFKVYCENGDGISSDKVTTLSIYIKPPFYRTWWFMMLIALLIAGLIYLAHRMRVNRLLAMEKVRTRIARDLHDDMGSTLSTINILSEMAKMKVHKDSEKTSEYLNKISDNSSRMMEAMDDIVWSINPMNDNMMKITARMREFATGVLEAKNIDFSFRVDDEVKELKLDMEARRDFFLLFKEAVNNLAKYSGCRHASIDISVQKSKLIMKIEDDGVGFDVATADSGNGLTNMRKRAQTLGGKLNIQSKKQEGTKVELEVGVS